MNWTIDLETEIKRNLRSNMEIAKENTRKDIYHLDKQEKYQFSLNCSFSRDDYRIQQEPVAGKQQQEMIVPAEDSGEEKARRTKKQRKCARSTEQERKASN